MKKPIIFVKIGGSLITDKNKPFTVKEQALDTIASEIHKATQLGKALIIGHGAGSFGHVPAKKYQTHLGLLNEQSREGIAEVATVARQLNTIVMNKIREKGTLAVAVSPLSMMTAKNFELGSIFTDPLEKLLELDMVPVLHGDQVLDVEKGCTIFSTEKVLGYLSLHLKEIGYQIEKIIHCGQTNGVYDADGNTIPMINSANFEDYKASLGGSGEVDVTGGMMHKVEETLNLAKQGIPGLIIDGVEHGSLSEAISGKEVLGTKVEA